MKTSFFLTCLFVVFLTSCNGSSQEMEVTPTVITVEVAEIAQITTTPVATITPSPSIEPVDIFATDMARRIGTPIVASDKCYETTRDPYSCADARLEELQNQMVTLLPTLEAYYRQRLPEGLEAMIEFQNFHTEWEDFSDRECKFRSRLGDSDYPQMLAPLGYDECMISKYENRLREYQIAIFTWTHR